MSSERISLNDIESKIRTLQGGVKSEVADRKQQVVAIAGGIGLVLLILAYLFGRRSGRRKTTLVEIRRS